jgi:hypothetical protein
MGYSVKVPIERGSVIGGEMAVQGKDVLYKMEKESHQ